MIDEFGRLYGAAKGYASWHLPIETGSNISDSKAREHSPPASKTADK